MLWDDVRPFLAVAREGSLSAAARRLRVEHTTVARRIAALEAALGLRLFDRLPRGWRLTAEGEGLLPLAERMEAEALAFARHAAGVSGASGTVRVSVPPALGALFVAPRLGALRRAHPGVAVDLVGSIQASNLSRREADIAVRLSAPTDPGLVTRRLGAMGYGLYGAPAYLAATAEDDWTFLGYEEDLAHVPQQRWLAGIAGPRPIVLRSNDLVALRAACQAGLGLAVLPHVLAVDDPGLERLPVPPPAPRDLWLLVHRDLRRSPRVRVVMDALVEMFAAGRPLLEPGS